MRLGRISLAALFAASAGFTGCAAGRSGQSASEYESLRSAEPPAHSSEFYSEDPGSVPRPRSSDRLSPQTPIPQPPPVPPAVGISRVKSVSFLPHLSTSFGSLGDAETQSVERAGGSSEMRPIGYVQQFPVHFSGHGCADSCTDSESEGCVNSEPKHGGCLKKLFRRREGLFRPLFGRRLFRSGSAEPSCATEECAEALLPATCGHGDDSSCTAFDSVCAPQPQGCTAAGQDPEWRQSTEALQSRKPCLADSLQDPFADETAAGRSPFSEPTPETFAAPAAPVQPVSPVPPGPVPVAPATPESQAIPIIPAIPEENQQTQALPLWPRLRSQPSISAAAHHVVPPVYRSAPLPPTAMIPAGSGASQTGNTIMPQIIPGR